MNVEVIHAIATAEVGYPLVEFGVGVEYTPETEDGGGGWTNIKTPIYFEPYRNFGAEWGDGRINTCDTFDYPVVPWAEVRMGLVFYDVVDVYLAPQMTVELDLTYPATCNDSIPACSYSPLVANMKIDLVLAMYIGLEVGADWVPFTNGATVTLMYVIS